MQNAYTAMDIAKTHAHSLRAVFAAGLITRKVGMSVDAQEGLYSMHEAFIAIGLSKPFSSRSRYRTAQNFGGRKLWRIQ